MRGTLTVTKDLRPHLSFLCSYSPTMKIRGQARAHTHMHKHTKHIIAWLFQKVSNVNESSVLQAVNRELMRLVICLGAVVTHFEGWPLSPASTGSIQTPSEVHLSGPAPGELLSSIQLPLFQLHSFLYNTTLRMEEIVHIQMQ